jgi:glutathione S-transferase
MADYDIYGDSGSGNCLKVLWLARHLGIEHRWIETSVLNRGTRTEAFRALNPSAQVPVLVHERRALAQSNAILLHLAEIHDSPLLPCEPFARAKVYEWLFWEQYSHEPCIAVRRFQKVYLKRRDDEIEPKLMERGVAALERMELELARSAFLAGPRATLADLALVAYTRVAPEGGFELESFPAIRRWIGSVEREFKIA